MVRQIKQHNSKHAFAAYLIITGQRSEYSDYIRHSNEKYVGKEAKLLRVKAKVEEMVLRNGGGAFEVMKKISAALAE